MTCELLEGITIMYEDELGTGGFSKVYKGWYKGKEIAVKIFRSTAPFYTEHFENEREILQSLGPHQNIVKLLGQYRESKTGCMGLCFEYINNGSLRKHLDARYDWGTWYAIILGICNGLKHLQELNPPILHMDINPDNILVDEKMVPKLADFGHARSLKDGKTQSTFHLIGTAPYRPPEYDDESKISKMHDIYSLGVVMMKILEGSKADPETNKTYPKTFKERVRAKWRNTTDPATLHNEQVKRCSDIGLRCVMANRLYRPTIEEIIKYLNEISQDPIPGSWIDQSGRHNLSESMGERDVEGLEANHPPSSTATAQNEQRKRRDKYSSKAFVFSIIMLGACLSSASSKFFKVAFAVYSIAFIAGPDFAKMVPNWDSAMVYISSSLLVLEPYFLLVSFNKVYVYAIVPTVLLLIAPALVQYMWQPEFKWELLSSTDDEADQELDGIFEWSSNVANGGSVVSLVLGYLIGPNQHTVASAVVGYLFLFTVALGIYLMTVTTVRIAALTPHATHLHKLLNGLIVGIVITVVIATVFHL